MSAGASDFASEAMVRALSQGMRALGLVPPSLPARPARATVPLDLKRALVQSAVQQGGLACLPLLGRGLHAFAMEPTHLALTASQDAGGMFVRWQRLERYIHSRHRTRVLDLGAGSARVRHEARDDGPAPLPVEDLVVCGVLCALLEANGLTGVRARIGSTPAYPEPQAKGIAARVREGATAEWHFSWEPPARRRAVSRPASPWPQVQPPVWSPLACRLGEALARHLPQALTLDGASTLLGMAPRSLQRALAAEGLSFTALSAEVRFRLAGWYLVRSDLALAETGFVCGYADQSHLTREFQRRTGLTPARYKALFAAG